jgi:hypothetical protein
LGTDGKWRGEFRCRRRIAAVLLREAGEALRASREKAVLRKAVLPAWLAAQLTENGERQRKLAEFVRQMPDCGAWGKHPTPNAGAVPRGGSDVGTSPLLAVSESGD